VRHERQRCCAHLLGAHLSDGNHVLLVEGSLKCAHAAGEVLGEILKIECPSILYFLYYIYTVTIRGLSRICALDESANCCTLRHKFAV